MKRMLSSREAFMARKIDTLPINVTHRNAARASFAASEASVTRVERAILRLRAFVASAGAEIAPRRRHHSVR